MCDTLIKFEAQTLKMTYPLPPLPCTLLPSLLRTTMMWLVPLYLATAHMG